MILYTSTSCGPCKQLKIWLYGKNVEVEERDVADYMEEFKKLGVRTVPTLVDGDHICNETESIKAYVESKRGS